MQFREVTIEDKPIFDKYILPKNFLGAEYSFSNIFIWRHTFKREFAVHDDTLFIRSTGKRGCFYFFPIGNAPYNKAFEQLKAFRCQLSGKLVVSGISERELTWLPNADEFENHTFANMSDYIYLSSDLIDLPGKKYHAKRNHINKFKSLYGDINYEDINQDNLHEILELDDLWRIDTDNENSAEARAIQSAINNFFKLELVGGALRVDGKIVAFTFGYPISSETFDINVEKADRNYQGAYAVINNEFARRNLSGYKYINREEDMGIDGLKKAKMSYYPAIILDKYFCTYKG